METAIFVGELPEILGIALRRRLKQTIWQQEKKCRQVCALVMRHSFDQVREDQVLQNDSEAIHGTVFGGVAPVFKLRIPSRENFSGNLSRW